MGPLMGLHQWLPRAHVECTAMGSAVLRGVFLKLRVAMLNYQMPFSFIAVRLVLTFISTVVMASTVDFKIFVAFSSISHMTLVFTGFYTNIYVRVLIYLVVLRRVWVCRDTAFFDFWWLLLVVAYV